MWTAVTLWVWVLVVGLAYALAAAHSIAAGGGPAAWIIGAPLLYACAVAAMTAVYFALAWIFRSRRPRDLQLGPGQTLRLVWWEFWALAGAAPRMMFYRALVPDPEPAPVGVPVLLLHGVLCNAGVWRRLTRFLASRDVPGVYTLSYGPPLASIELFAEQMEAKIDAIRVATGARRVMVVSHSMGGLVARAYLRRYGAGKLARVLTIGAPHHGSVHAWMFPGTSLSQLRPGSPWLAALGSERLDPALRFVSLWSWHDSMVAPQLSSRLAGAIDVALAGIGHNALLGDPGVFAQVLAEIEEARTAPPR
ncbi:MAG TPA: alpha/beta fold hydrolase [Casimicrobiaceae bacterium]|nr:alpha/beta fold hydrolase [Casimicrobiaceae bacterium]